MTRVNEQFPLPTDSAFRKEMPIARGLLDYFPQACAYVSRISFLGNEKHNGPDSELHWARGKSMDQDDCIIRHTIERGSFDPDDGALHDGKRAWRALAALELELERRIEAGEPLWAEDVIATNRAKAASKKDIDGYFDEVLDAAIRMVPRTTVQPPWQRHPPGASYGVDPNLVATDEETGAQLTLAGIIR